MLRTANGRAPKSRIKKILRMPCKTARFVPNKSPITGGASISMQHAASQRQLTLRAIIAGMMLGGLMSLSNLYVSLKTGWSLGVSITAGILAFAMFTVLLKLRIVRSAFGMLENNAM